MRSGTWPLLLIDSLIDTICKPLYKKSTCDTRFNISQQSYSQSGSKLKKNAQTYIFILGEVRKKSGLARRISEAASARAAQIRSKRPHLAPASEKSAEVNGKSAAASEKSAAASEKSVAASEKSGGATARSTLTRPSCQRTSQLTSGPDQSLNSISPTQFR